MIKKRKAETPRKCANLGSGEAANERNAEVCENGGKATGAFAAE
jgi:hypothetical protein